MTADTHHATPNRRTARLVPTVLLAGALAFVSGTTTQASWQLPPLLIIQYQLIDSAPHLNGVDYVLRARLLNLGPAIPGATARLTGTSAAVTLLDDVVTFGPMERFGSVWSTDTFAIRRHGKWLDVLSTLRWTIAPLTGNQPPVADAGPDRTVHVLDVAQLDGSGSFDPDGDALTFSWRLDERPATSQATLDDAAAVRPALTIDAPGAYVVRLTVHDGLAASQTDTVVLRTDNSLPVANAGADGTARVGDEVTLDGSGSSDVDGDVLTYAWSLIARPDGSAATLDAPYAVAPGFVVDQPGDYVAQLVVNDGTAHSAADTVVISTLNSRPVANAGPDQAVVVGQGTSLDGSGSSDPDGDPLTFQWGFTARPAGSSAIIADPTAPVATFVADVPGDYAVQLIVSDGQVESLPDTVLISTTNAAPAADAGPDQLGVPVGSTVTLDGSGSTDPDGHALTYTWSLISRPSGSLAQLSETGAVEPSLVADVADDYVAQLVVHDGFTSSAPDTVRIQAVAPVIVTIEATTDASEVGPDAGSFTIARTGPTDDALDVDVLVQGSATNGVDYATIPDVITIPAGSAAATVTVLPVDDGVVEGTEGVILTLQPGSGYAVGSPGMAQVVIADSSRPTVTVSATVPEAREAGPVAGAFTFVRTGPTSSSLQVLFARSGTASDAADYVSIGGATAIVTIPAGESSIVLPIEPYQDNLVEGPETVVVTLSAAGAYLVGTPAGAEVTILDDPAIVSITAIDANAAEQGSDPGVVLLSRDGGDLSAALDVGLQFGGTASTQDFASVPATVAIPAGQAELRITIEPRRDNLVETPEAVVVTLAPRTTYQIGAPSATVTIADDPPVAGVVASDADASESGPDHGAFTFVRTGGDLAAPLVVFFSRSGTATSGADYVSIGGSTATVTIPAGDSSVVVTITVIPDAVVEPPETVEVTIVPRVSYLIGTPGSATVVIQDGLP